MKRENKKDFKENGDKTEQKKKKDTMLKGNTNALKHGGYAVLSRRKWDGRTRLVKQLNALKRAMINDLGGIDNITQGQELLIDRIKFKVASLHFMELAVASGQLELPDKYIQLANSFRQDLQTLGLERKQKDYITLNDYLEKKDQER